MSPRRKVKDGEMVGDVGRGDRVISMAAQPVHLRGKRRGPGAVARQGGAVPNIHQGLRFQISHDQGVFGGKVAASGNPAIRQDIKCVDPDIAVDVTAACPLGQAVGDRRAAGINSQSIPVLFLELLDITDERTAWATARPPPPGPFRRRLAPARRQSTPEMRRQWLPAVVWRRQAPTPPTADSTVTFITFGQRAPSLIQATSLQRTAPG